MTPKNKYKDKRYSIIISEKSGYESSSQKDNFSKKRFNFDNKESFITDSKVSDDYFKNQSISVNNSIKSKIKTLKKEKKEKNNINHKNNIGTKKICENIKHENCGQSKSHNINTKRQSYLNILKL